MDAVELPYPVDVVVPRLMGSEGFGRAGVRVTVKEADACESNRDSMLVSPSIERCSTYLRQKDTTNAINASEAVSCDRISDTEFCRHASQLPRFQGEHVSEQLHSRGINCRLLTPRSESVQENRKAGKVSRSSSGCSKRQRMAQLEDARSPAGVDDIKDISDKLESYPTKCNSPEKTQLVKQKSNFSSKRGDKRNSKIPLKTKFDSFSTKAGFASFNSAAGANNFLGVYGLKSEIHDVTKLVDDLSLNELLEGTYECPSLGKEKGKKAVNMNETIVHSIKKACSILPLPRPAQVQNFAEIDSCSNKKMPTCISSSVSFIPNGISGDNGDSCSTDLSSCDKIQDSCSKPETPVNPLDFPLYEPKDILERLALPPPKDLESLLLDAAKPAVSSRNTPDQRSSKQISRRASLPSFPWSHTFSGHCRTNSDTAKFLTSRSTCQGRWAIIGNSTSSPVIAANCFTNLELLTYNQSLVPSGGPKLGISENKSALSMSDGIPWGEQGSSSHATYFEGSHVPLESGSELKYQGNAGHCPTVLAAAQILCDMANHSSGTNLDGMIRWPKKPPQKAMKARKSKSVEKAEEIYATTVSVFGSDSVVRSGADQIIPSSKRPKLSMIETKKDLGQANFVRKGPVNWSAPRSSRSSPSKSLRDSITETRQSAPGIVKQSLMLPPPSRVLNKACNSQQKLRKIMPMDWNRGRDRLD